jgi:hypothetical protein
VVLILFQCCYKYKCACKCAADVKDIEDALNMEKTHPSKDYALDSEWVEMVDPESGKP